MYSIKAMIDFADPKIVDAIVSRSRYALLRLGKQHSHSDSS